MVALRHIKPTRPDSRCEQREMPAQMLCGLGERLRMGIGDDQLGGDLNRLGSRGSRWRRVL
jgi:hypothetical protein